MFLVIKECKPYGTWYSKYQEAEKQAKSLAESTGLVISIVKEVAVVALPKVEPVVTKVDERL